MVVVEHYEWIDMYPSFAKKTNKEALLKSSELYGTSASSKNITRSALINFWARSRPGDIFKSDIITVWRYLNYGCIYEGKEPSQKYPTCGYTPSAVLKRFIV